MLLLQPTWKKNIDISLTDTVLTSIKLTEFISSLQNPCRVMPFFYQFSTRSTAADKYFYIKSSFYQLRMLNARKEPLKLNPASGISDAFSEVCKTFETTAFFLKGVPPIPAMKL